jgi:methionine synthase II (cobalamin-independent)
MYVQYSAALPGLVVDEARERVYFDVSQDLSGPLESFYTDYLEENLDAFGLGEAYAAGFYAMLRALERTPGQWVKGQVTGPISFGLTVTDQTLRASLYHDQLGDAIVKNAAMAARWQVRQLKSRRPDVILFVDEPYMASFGSAFISLSREQVVSMLDEVFEAIHAEGALAGVHCCANTDWSVLLATQVDLLNLDAYGFIENLALYPAELRAYLDRGGNIAWGAVPNNELILQESPQALAERLRRGFEQISQKAAARGVDIHPAEFASRSLILPACGLGSTSVEIAERVLETLPQVEALLKG